jgi:hypothetical protein
MDRLKKVVKLQLFSRSCLFWLGYYVCIKSLHVV